ncbi:MAG: O-antigen ligase family protein [Sumerlaeia bacterium]
MSTASLLGRARRILPVVDLYGFMALAFLGTFLAIAVVLIFTPKLGLTLMLGALIGTALIAAGPRLTFPLYFATLFSFGFNLPGLPMSLNRVLALAFFGSWIVALGRRHFRIPNTPAVYLLGLTTIYAVVTSALLSLGGAELPIQPVFYFVVALAVGSWYRRPSDYLELIGIALTITCAFHSIGIIEYIIRRDLFREFSDVKTYGDRLRINGISKNAIQYAYIATFMTPLALLLATNARTARVRKWSLLAVGFLLLGCLLTLNRQTPIILFAMFCVGLPLLRYRYRGRLAMAMVVGALAVSPAIVAKALPRIQTIFRPAETTKPDISLAIRADKLKIAFEIIQDRPLFGVGLNNFDAYHRLYIPTGELYLVQYDVYSRHYVDMGFVQLLTETGLVGLGGALLFFLAAAGLWIGGFRRACAIRSTTFYRNAYAALAMMYVQMLMSLLVQDTFYLPWNFLLFGFLLAVTTMTRDAWVREHTPPLTPESSTP